MKKILKNKYSQVLLFFLLLVFINSVVSRFTYRLDLTEEKRYTLNNNTKDLLKKLDDEVYIKIYLDGDLPVNFKKFQRAIINTLKDFKSYSSANVEYTLINPTASTKKEERFRFYNYLYKKGITPVEIQEQDVDKKSETMLFPAVIVSYKGKELGVNLLQSNSQLKKGSEENINASIKDLEYRISNAIRKLTRKKVEKIAFIEGQGELTQIEVASITKVLSEYYQIDRGNLVGKLNQLNDYKALIIASPLLKFSNEDKYILDQYVMQGGNILFMLEGVNVRMDSLNTKPYTLAMPMSVNLEDMLFKYGVRINPDLVEDLQCSKIGLATSGYANKTEIKWYPWYFFPQLVSPNDHPVNKYIDLIRTEFISTIDTVNHTPGVKKTILLATSKNSRITSVPLPISFQGINKAPDKNKFRHKPLPVAVLLEGQFTSLFKNRIAPIQAKNYTTKDKSKEAKIVVVSDGDMIRNMISPEGKAYPLGFDRYSQHTFKGNAQFILNTMNYLCGDAKFMSVRNREVKLRLLDKDRLKNEKSFWQFINLGVPIIILIIGGLIFMVIRKRRYSRHL